MEENYKGFRIEFIRGDKIVRVYGPGDRQALDTIGTHRTHSRDQLRALARARIDHELSDGLGT
jgi:hypothetical protein